MLMEREIGIEKNILLNLNADMCMPMDTLRHWRVITYDIHKDRRNGFKKLTVGSTINR